MQDYEEDEPVYYRKGATGRKPRKYREVDSDESDEYGEYHFDDEEKQDRPKRSGPTKRYSLDEEEDEVMPTPKKRGRPSS